MYTSVTSHLRSTNHGKIVATSVRVHGSVLPATQEALYYQYVSYYYGSDFAT
eukprot:COSAG01_NODE_2611_length_7384_cov_7.141386_10_plen_52_part_00